MDKNKYYFFGSKLNTALLLVLIILMIFALRIMREEPEKYLPDLAKDKLENTAFYGVLGNKDDLVFFTILPNTKVHGILSYRGQVKGGYFFEANILINILDMNKKVLKNTNAVAKSDWMTAGPVDFEGYVDFTNLPKGPAYFEIHNDNASGLPENDKSILIPIVIE
jgi:hypothetical protein